jgi:hypothetical protein
MAGLLGNHPGFQNVAQSIAQKEKCRRPYFATVYLMGKLTVGLDFLTESQHLTAFRSYAWLQRACARARVGRDKAPIQHGPFHIVSIHAPARDATVPLPTSR